MNELPSIRKTEKKINIDGTAYDVKEVVVKAKTIEKAKRIFDKVWEEVKNENNKTRKK